MSRKPTNNGGSHQRRGAGSGDQSLLSAPLTVQISPAIPNQELTPLTHAVVPPMLFFLPPPPTHTHSTACLNFEEEMYLASPNS